MKKVSIFEKLANRGKNSKRYENNKRKIDDDNKKDKKMRLTADIMKISKLGGANEMDFEKRVDKRENDNFYVQKNIYRPLSENKNDGDFIMKPEGFTGDIIYEHYFQGSENMKYFDEMGIKKNLERPKEKAMVIEKPTISENTNLDKILIQLNNILKKENMDYDIDDKNLEYHEMKIRVLYNIEDSMSCTSKNIGSELNNCLNNFKLTDELKSDLFNAIKRIYSNNKLLSEWFLGCDFRNHACDSSRCVIKNFNGSLFFSLITGKYERTYNDMYICLKSSKIHKCSNDTKHCNKTILCQNTGGYICPISGKTFDFYHNNNIEASDQDSFRKTMASENIPVSQMIISNSEKKLHNKFNTSLKKFEKIINNDNNSDSNIGLMDIFDKQNVNSFVIDKKMDFIGNSDEDVMEMIKNTIDDKNFIEETKNRKKQITKSKISFYKNVDNFDDQNNPENNNDLNKKIDNMIKSTIEKFCHSQSNYINIFHKKFVDVFIENIKKKYKHDTIEMMLKCEEFSLHPLFLINLNKHIEYFKYLYNLQIDFIIRMTKTILFCFYYDKKEKRMKTFKKHTPIKASQAASLINKYFAYKFGFRHKTFEEIFKILDPYFGDMVLIYPFVSSKQVKPYVESMTLNSLVKSWNKELPSISFIKQTLENSLI